MKQRIADVRVTPIAFRDPPLLNVNGVHERFALRSVIEIETEGGHVGLGESYGDLTTLADLNAAAPRLVGNDIFDLNALARICAETVPPHLMPGKNFPPDNSNRRIAVATGAFEVAMLDLQGQVLGRPLCDILGGACRARVPYSAYLFYKFARHRDDPNPGPDPFGEALTPEGIVAQARWMGQEFGFGSIKLKGGVFAPEEEIAALRALRAAFPKSPLRIDPNGGWTVSTTLRVLPQLAGLIEYLEDPVRTLGEMGEIAKTASMPLATNMVTVAFGHIPETLRLGAVQVILSDHHYWGGLRATQQLAHMARVFGLGVSMHSNSHLGITLAAMTHVAASIPNLAYACDTHYPWALDEVIEGGKLRFEAGSLAPPPGPGLGVRLDRAALKALHALYLSCGIRVRNDEAEMRKYQPEWSGKLPRF